MASLTASEADFGLAGQPDKIQSIDYGQKKRQPNEEVEIQVSKSPILNILSCFIDCDQAFTEIYLVIGVLTMGVIYFNVHFADYYVCNEDLFTSSAESSKVVPLLAEMCAGKDKFYNTLYITAIIVAINAFVMKSIDKFAYSSKIRKTVDKIEVVGREIAPITELNKSVACIIKATVFYWTDVARATGGVILKFVITFLIWYFVYGQHYDQFNAQNTFWMLRKLVEVKSDFMQLPVPYTMNLTCSGEFPWVGRLNDGESHYYTVDCLRSRLPILYCVLAVSEILLIVAMAVFAGDTLALLVVVASHHTASEAGIYLALKLAQVPPFINGVVPA